MNQTAGGNSFVLNNNLKFNISKKNKYFNSSAGWVYGRQNGQLTNNDLNAVMDFELFTRPKRLYYWGLAAYDKSYSLRINDRFQGGAGAGYKIVNTKTTEIVISDGILYEFSNVRDTAAKNDDYETFRNSLRLKFHFLFSNLVQFDGVNYWQPSLSDGSDYILKSTTTLSLKLKKWLSLTSSLTYNRVSRTNSKNLLFTAGIATDYYF